MASPGFVHLRLHSHYAIRDGIIRIDPLLERCRELGMPAVALTDPDNLFAAVRFYKKALAKGIKPILGCDLTLEGGRVVTLLVQNGEGYRNLSELLTRRYRSGRPVSEGELLERSGGLIVLLGWESPLGERLLAEQEGEGLLRRWLDAFGDRLYLELQRLGKEHEPLFEEGALDLAERLEVPVVATCDVRFLSPEEFESHEVRVCIQEGWTVADEHRPRRYSDRQYLQSPEEMAERFSDLPEALANTVEVAKRCNFRFELGRYRLPAFPLPEGQTVEERLREESERGLRRRLEGMAEEARARYFQRLSEELAVIEKMGFSGYFLIVADFINWAKKNGIPVGPGRGSGAGSLVAFALGITEIDPIRFDLLFERFLNPERVSLPDFDVDFCMERRDEVIDYVVQKYGRSQVAQIVTLGRLQAKAAVRDVGRALGHPYGFVDRIARLIPNRLGTTLEQALSESEELKRLYESDEDARTILDFALKLEGIVRTAGKHAGGVVIAPEPLERLVPLYRAEGEEGQVTQFDKDDLDAIGLVKFDFLGLRTLTILDWALEAINRRRKAQGEPPLDLKEIPLDDPETYRLLQSGRTAAVFQLESRGMQELLKRLRPDHFEDLIALVALYRPGPLQSGMVDDYLKVKHGEAQASYPHPLLEPILKRTYGVILYQEQVMEIARQMAGYTLGAADLLRRAMGKKKPEEMAAHRKRFVEGALERGVDLKTAHFVFDLMEKFAGYGFNRSHSAAYALITYRAAYLKAHYPAEFMAAVLSSEMDKSEKVAQMVAECRQMGLELLPPDINASDHRFRVEEGKIRYGLGAVRGVGEAVVEEILRARREGPFRDLLDFALRVDLRTVNRRAIEALIRAGAFDRFGHRAQLLADLEAVLSWAERQKSAEGDLFGLETLSSGRPERVEMAPWSARELLEEERKALGFYFSGHPVASYREELAGVISGTIAALRERCASSGRLEGVSLLALVAEVRRRRTRKEERFLVARLEDETDRLEAVLYPEKAERLGEKLAKDQIVVASGALAYDRFNDQLRLEVEELLPLEEARSRLAELWLELDGKVPLEPLVELLARNRGPCPVFIRYHSREAEAVLRLGRGVLPSDRLLEALRALLGEARVRLRCREREPERAAARSGVSS